MKVVIFTVNAKIASLEKIEFMHLLELCLVISPFPSKKNRFTLQATKLLDTDQIPLLHVIIIFTYN